MKYRPIPNLPYIFVLTRCNKTFLALDKNSVNNMKVGLPVATKFSCFTIYLFIIYKVSKEK